MKKLWRLLGIVAITIPFYSSIVSAEDLSQPANSAAAKEQIKEKTEETRSMMQLLDSSSNKEEIEPSKSSSEESSSSSETFSTTKKSPDNSKKEKKTKAASQSETSGTWGTVDWTFDSTSGVLVLQDGDAGTTGQKPWAHYPSALKKIIVQGEVYLPSNCYSLFYGLQNLQSIEQADNLSTSGVTNMSCLFFGCSSLTSLDTDSWDTSSVTDMSYLFFGCSSLTSLDTDSWNMSSVTDMSYLFFGCSSLTNLDTDSWNMSSVTDMSYLFSDCSSLTNLDNGSWNTSQITNMSHLFFGCSSLTSLDIGSWDTSSVTDMSHLFSGCSSLTSLDTGRWNTSQVTNMNNMFAGCESLTTLDVSNWRTNLVTNMINMFGDCRSLTRLDVSKWETSRVESMSSLFFGCNNLTDLDISNWKTDRVTDMSEMFDTCYSLTALDVSKWKTDQVTNMSEMYYQCRKLTNIDVSKWKTDQVSDMFDMFYDCRSLTSINLSNWKTDQVSDMSELFFRCNKLSHIKLGKQFVFIDPDDSNILNMPPFTFPYARKWQKDQQGKAYTSDELAKQYDGSTMAGDYYWARYAAPVTVKYLNEKGQPLVPDKSIGKDNSYVNDPYDTTSLNPGISRIYQLDTNRLPTNEKGKLGEDPITVSYYYKKILDDPGDAGNEGTGSLDDLSLDYVSNFDFESQKISANQQSYPAKAEQPHVQITDQRKNASGWEVQVSISPIQTADSQQVLEGATLSLVKEKILSTTSSSGADPTTNDIILSSQPQTVFRATSGQGKGSWINKFDRTKSILTVPGGVARAKSYQATLNWTLNVGPDN